MSDSNSLLRGNLTCFSSWVKAHEGHCCTISWFSRYNLNSLCACSTAVVFWFNSFFFPYPPHAFLSLYLIIWCACSIILLTQSKITCLKTYCTCMLTLPPISLHSPAVSDSSWSFVDSLKILTSFEASVWHFISNSNPPCCALLLRL